MPMRKTALRLTLLALVAGSAADALAQSLPTSQPQFLQIYRETIKPGRTRIDREPNTRATVRSHSAFIAP